MHLATNGLPWPVQPGVTHEGSVAALTFLPDVRDRAPVQLPHVPSDIDEPPGTDSEEEDLDGSPGTDLWVVVEKARLRRERIERKAAAMKEAVMNRFPVAQRQPTDEVVDTHALEHLEADAVSSGPCAHVRARLLSVCSRGQSITLATGDMAELSRDHVGVTGTCWQELCVFPLLPHVWLTLGRGCLCRAIANVTDAAVTKDGSMVVLGSATATPATVCELDKGVDNAIEMFPQTVAEHVPGTALHQRDRTSSQDELDDSAVETTSRNQSARIVATALSWDGQVACLGSDDSHVLVYAATSGPRRKLNATLLRKPAAMFTATAPVTTVAVQTYAANLNAMAMGAGGRGLNADCGHGIAFVLAGDHDGDVYLLSLQRLSQPEPRPLMPPGAALSAAAQSPVAVLRSPSLHTPGSKSTMMSEAKVAVHAAMVTAVQRNRRRPLLVHATASKGIAPPSKALLC